MASSAMKVILILSVEYVEMFFSRFLTAYCFFFVVVRFRKTNHVRMND